MCHNGFTIKNEFFKYKRFKGGGGGAPIKILGRAPIMCILKLDHIAGPIYLILCFP